MTLDTTDRAIIEATQAGLPLTQRPYHDIAERIGVSPLDVMERIRALQARGIIRRIGAVPNHYKLGYRANGMSVWDVDDARISALGAAVGGLDCVSHCYRRPRIEGKWRFNLFAMVHGRNRDEVMAHIGEIKALLGDAARAHDVLFSTKILKKTGLRLAR